MVTDDMGQLMSKKKLEDAAAANGEVAEGESSKAKKKTWRPNRGKYNVKDALVTGNVPTDSKAPVSGNVSGGIGEPSKVEMEGSTESNAPQELVVNSEKDEKVPLASAEPSVVSDSTIGESIAVSPTGEPTETTTPTPTHDSPTSVTVQMSEADLEIKPDEHQVKKRDLSVTDPVEPKEDSAALNITATVEAPKEEICGVTVDEGLESCVAESPVPAPVIAVEEKVELPELVGQVESAKDPAEAAPEAVKTFAERAEDVEPVIVPEEAAKVEMEPEPSELPLITETVKAPSEPTEVCGKTINEDGSITDFVAPLEAKEPEAVAEPIIEVTEASPVQELPEPEILPLITETVSAPSEATEVCGKTLNEDGSVTDFVKPLEEKLEITETVPAPVEESCGVIVDGDVTGSGAEELKLSGGVSAPSKPTEVCGVTLNEDGSTTTFVAPQEAVEKESEELSLSGATSPTTEATEVCGVTVEEDGSTKSFVAPMESPKEESVPKLDLADVVPTAPTPPLTPPHKEEEAIVTPSMEIQ